MAKSVRYSKPLLFTLTSAIGVATTATVGVTIKLHGFKTAQTQMNLLANANVSDIPNYNISNRNMFSVNPSDINKFNFASVRKGQSSTPYGWLGVADAANEKYKEITLTNWSGEVLWRTKLNLAANTAIYDIKYDIGSNMVFVLASNKPSGAFDTDKANTSHDSVIYALNAVTGKPYTMSRNNLMNAESITKAGELMRTRGWGEFKFSGGINDGNNWRIRDLYSIDVVSGFKMQDQNFGAKNKVLFSYAPNVMQLYKDSKILTMNEVITNFKTTNFIALANRRNDQVELEWKTIDLFHILKDQAPGKPWGKWWINANGNFNWSYDQSDWLSPSNAYMLTSPFWTAAPGSDLYFLHFFFASGESSNLRTFHSVIKFDQNLNPIATDFEQLQNRKVGNSPLDLHIKNIDWILKANELPKELVLNYPANTKVNHNMFKPNFVTFSYPYSAKDVSGFGRVPFYNVAQIGFNDQGLITRNITSKLTSKVYNIGIKNEKYPSSSRDAGNTFSRLVSVNPFDNSFVYFTNPNGTPTNQLGMFIVRSTTSHTSLNNLSVLKLTNLDANKTNYSKIYTEGFGFDPIVDALKLSLYYNMTDYNHLEYGSPDGFKAGQIGFIDQFGQSFQDFNANANAFGINANSYASIIHSRADIDKWYPNSLFNYQYPANLLPMNKLIVGANKRHLVAIDKKWKPRSNDIIDTLSIVSHEQRSTVHDNKRAVKSPAILVGGDNNTLQQLKLTFSWDHNSSQFDNQYKALYDSWDNANSKMRYRITKNIQIPSWQILNKFGAATAVSQKISGWTGQSDNLNIDVTPMTGQSWFDVRRDSSDANKSAAQLFGTKTNATNVNNQIPIRLLARIVKPVAAAGKVLPAWINQIDQRFWEPAPLVALSGETSFNQLVNQYVKTLVNQISNQTSAVNNEMPLSLASLKIKAFYGLNPAAAKGGKIYQNGTKTYLQDNNGQIIIYEDYSAADEGIIYDQNAITFDGFKDQGLNSANVMKNWTGMPSSNKLVIGADLTRLRWPIVDTGVSFNEAAKSKIFQAEYDRNGTNLMIESINQSQRDWLQKTLTTMNFKYGLQVVFEYQNNQNQWQSITNTALTDANLQQMYTNNRFNIPTSIKNIRKLRIRLQPFSDQEVTSNPNVFVRWTNVSENKLTSAVHLVAAQKITFNRQWLENSDLTFNKTLDQIDETPFTEWLNKIKIPFEAANQAVSAAWSKLEVVYTFEGQEYSQANLVAKLKSELSNFNRADHGWFYLWTGTAADQNGLKIEARFQVKSQFANDFSLIDQNGTQITSAQTKTPIKTKIKTKFDFKTYFDQLEQTPLVAQMNSVPGQLSQIQMPAGSNGIFTNQTFDQIKQMANLVGIKFQFQAANNSGWTNVWVDEYNLVQTYNPNNPQIKIRAILRAEAYINSAVYDGVNALDQNNAGRTINLQLPKLIQGPANFQAQLKQLVQDNNPFGGNTKFISLNNIDEFEVKIYEQIQQASKFSDDQFKTFLKFKYQVGYNGLWLQKDEIINQLKQASSDLTGNEIKIQFSLENLNPTHPEYILDVNLNQSTELLADNNEVVKIYVHGNDWETAITKIVANGNDRNNISYTIDPVLNPLKTAVVKGVKWQWRFADGKLSNQWADYIDTPLPNNLTQYPDYVDAGAIEVRIKHDDNDKIYHYGPEQDQSGNSWNTGRIDLSKLNRPVVVDPNWFSQNDLVLQTKDLEQVNVNDFNQFEQKIKGLISGDQQLKNQIEIQYNIIWSQQNNLGSSMWLDANEVIKFLVSATIDYQNPTHNGIISLSNIQNTNSYQTKIVARFVAKTNSNISFTDASGAILTDNQLIGQVKTDNIQTTIDLSAYWNKIQTDLTTVIALDPMIGTIQNQTVSPPDNIFGSHLFSGKTFKEINQMLSKFGIKWLFNANVSANTTPNWVENGNIDHYDPTQAKMWIAIENKSTNLKVKLDSNQTIGVGQNNKANQTVIRLNVPKLINLQQSWFNDFVKDHGFSGNTKHLVISEAKIAALINNLQTNLSKVNPELAQAPIAIKFQLGSTNFVDASELVTALANQSNDLTTRVINYKIELDAKANPNDWILGGYATTNGVALFSEDQSPLKIFLHDDGIVDRLKNVQLSGTNDNVQWNFNQLVVNQVSGIITSPEKQSALKVEYNLNSANSNHNDWTSQQVHQFVAGKQQMWIRLNYASTSSEAKYEFENSTAIRQALPIDLTKLKSTIKLQANWLNKIVASNNLINLELDESALRNHLLDQNVLDPVKISDLEVQYSINGKTNWLNKENFISFLKQNDGKEDGDRFILKRENVKVRFGLKSDITADAYGWEIDGVQIHSNIQYQNHYQNLVGASYNQNLKGVINLTLVPEFIKDNFWIKGTNQRPQLEVKHATSILNKFNLYQSDRLFEIVLSTSKSNGDFEWNQAIPIWQNGTFVSDLNVVLQDVKNAAIRFKVTAPNYVVKTAPNQDNFAQEMTFDISDQIEVITLIANIFQAARKTLAIQTRENGVAKWMQGHGQFQIMVGDSNWMPENQSAQDFLQANAALSQALKDKLEFVYQIFDNQPTEEQISVQSSPECINDPTSAWTVFPNQNGWSGDLGLKVGNYIMVALRIKPEFASGPQAYVLENQAATVLIPVNKQVGSDEPIEKRHPGRVAGYLVDPLQALVVKNSVVLASQKPQTRGLLDGWAKLERLSLANEPDENARGIDLELNFYNKFHVDQSNKVLISASGAKLVQREQNNMDRGLAYVDVNGKPIQDRDGQVVYLWTNPLTGRLANPLTASTPTLSLKLTNREFANYTLDQLLSEPNLISLFRNQKLTLTYKAKEGLGTSKLPDYALKQSYEFDLEPLVSPQIKFAIENPQNIIYDWLNRDAFAADKIEYTAPASALKPVNGFARVKTIAQLQRRRRNNGTEVNIISGSTGPEAALNFLKTIQADFKNQLKFTTTLIKKAGGSVVRDNSANLYEFNNLHNGDQIVVNLDAAAPDQIYTDAPEPLVILVSGLAVEAPDPALLQWLRVEQSGFANGRGAFRLLVHNPNGPYQAPEELLRGWQFLIRVWDGVTHQIKIDWTADQEMLTNLSNGDRVEWKLVDREKNPVQDAYYNTVALRHEITGANGAIKFNFGQVNYADGPNSQQVVYAGIGDYPPKAQAEHFPAASGFTIAGLQDQSQRFDLQPWAFAKIIETLGPFYRGQNGNGALNFNHQYFEGLWYVNLAGELYQTPRYPEQDLHNPQEIPLSQFLIHTTFFTQDPTLNPTQTGFKFMANATNTGNYLSNGDRVWAQFDSVIGSDATGNNPAVPQNLVRMPEDKPALSYVHQLPDVSGLDQISDPMHPLWWILIVLAGLITLGGVWFVVWHQRHHKLKIKKP